MNILPYDELAGILNSYRRRQKYYKLKSGEFLKLENNSLSVLSELADGLRLSEQAIRGGRISVPLYRASYIDAVLTSHNSDMQSHRDRYFKSLIRDMKSVAEPYIRGRALRHFEKGRIVIFAAGIGSPYFSTDTTAALRAAEIESDAILMAKNGVDGVYNDDPRKNADAVKFAKLTHVEVIKRGLKIMDATASTLSMDNDIDLVVFNMNEPGNIKRVIFGEQIGTTVSNKAELRK